MIQGDKDLFLCTFHVEHGINKLKWLPQKCKEIYSYNIKLAHSKTVTIFGLVLCLI